MNRRFGWRKLVGVEPACTTCFQRFERDTHSLKSLVYQESQSGGTPWYKTGLAKGRGTEMERD